jgi:hypothetical protein
MNNLYQIFYPYNKFDSIESIDGRLSKFMYSKNYIEFETTLEKDDTPQEIIVEEEVVYNSSPPPEPIIEKKVSSKLIIPDKIDTLFWCIYIAHYGYDTYMNIRNKYMNEEFVEKSKIMEYLKANKNILKTIHKKITNNAHQEIMSELLTNKKTSILAVNAFAVYYKTNIVIENTLNGTYIEFVYNEEAKWIHVKYINRGRYGISEIRPIANLGIKLECSDKPLKGISTYKVSELNEIASKIPSVENDPQRSSWKKDDLYGNIWRALLWT